MIQPTYIPIHHPHTASRVFSGEAVVITPAANMVRMFNPVGSHIWELIDGQRTVGEIIRMLVAQYDVTPERATTTGMEFFAMLQEKQLILWKTANV